MLLEVGDCNQPPTEFPLEAGERVLGIKSRLSDKGQNIFNFDFPISDDLHHYDLQFVIGKMES